MFESIAPSSLPPELRWRYVTLLPGEKVLCWLAGKPIGVDVHWGRNSQPCYKSITKGKLACYYGERCSPRFVAYVPLITMERRERLVVIASKSLWPTVSAFAHGLPLEVLRPKRDNNPALEFKMYNGTGVDPANNKRASQRTPDDIRPYLLHLWQDRKLCEFCGAEFFPSAKTQEQEMQSMRLHEAV